jgi:hypothetical protein
VYLGKVPKTSSYNQKTYSEDYYQNCFSGYYLSIASLVPSNCIRMDIADEADPNILIDARWYDFRPCTSNTCNGCDWPGDSILHSVDYNDPMVVSPKFKSLVTDGTVVISGLESNFYWNDEGIHNGDSLKHCTLYLQAWKYQFKNVFENSEFGGYYGAIGKPGSSDVTFLMKSLVGGKGIRIMDLGCKLKIYYTATSCDETPALLTPITCEPYIPASIGIFIN